MEYQIRRAGDEAWILIPVRLLSEVQGNRAESNEAGRIDEAEGGKRQKAGAEKLRREILNFCGKPRSRKEIAQQFEFSTSEYVIQKYVLPLVRSRMLQMTIPDHPKSKNQKYFSIQIPLDENETT